MATTSKIGKIDISVQAENLSSKHNKESKYNVKTDQNTLIHKRTKVDVELNKKDDIKTMSTQRYDPSHMGFIESVVYDLDQEVRAGNMDISDMVSEGAPPMPQSENDVDVIAEVQRPLQSIIGMIGRYNEMMKKANPADKKAFQELINAYVACAMDFIKAMENLNELMLKWSEKDHERMHEMLKHDEKHKMEKKQELLHDLHHHYKNELVHALHNAISMLNEYERLHGDHPQYHSHIGEFGADIALYEK